MGGPKHGDVDVPVRAAELNRTRVPKCSKHPRHRQAH